MTQGPERTRSFSEGNFTEVRKDRTWSGVGYPLRSVSVIIPVFNERDSIGRVIEQALAVELPLVKMETIVVDDGSTDGTQEWLQQLFYRPLGGIPSFRLLCHPRNFGKGAAVRTGIKHAESDVIVILDADLELDPANIPRLVIPILIGEADVVFGNRFADGARGARNLVHFLTTRSLTLLASLLTSLDLHDVEVGYKAFRTDMLHQMSLRSMGFEVEVELVVKTAKLQCRLCEVPVAYAPRMCRQGKKFGWYDGILAVYWLLYFEFFDRFLPFATNLRPRKRRAITK